MRSTTKLRQLLSRPDITVTAGCWDTFSAKLVEQAGFEATILSGSCVTGSMLGMNDFNYITQTELLDVIRRITAVVSFPLIADGEEGFGNPPEVQRTVRLYEQAGAAGLHIEDMKKPKRCAMLSTSNEGKLVSTADMVQRVKAAVDARRDSDFLIIARHDAYEGIDAAIERCNAYADAGAEMVFYVGFSSVDDMRRAAKEIKVPLMLNQMSGITTPVLPNSDLEAMGYKLVLYSTQGYEIAYLGARDWLKGLSAILKDKTMQPPAGLGLRAHHEIENILGMADDMRVQQKYLLNV